MGSPVPASTGAAPTINPQTGLVRLGRALITAGPLGPSSRINQLWGWHSRELPAQGSGDSPGLVGESQGRHKATDHLQHPAWADCGPCPGRDVQLPHAKTFKEGIFPSF